MGLAGLSIALGQNIAPFLDQIVEPIIDSLSHTDSKVRYFACESAYNVAKVAKGEILVGLHRFFCTLWLQRVSNWFPAVWRCSYRGTSTRSSMRSPK